MTLAPQILFWLCLGLLGFTFAGYHLLMLAMAQLGEDSPAGSPPAPPTVTVILAAHNESARILSRLENLLASDYPPERLRLIVASDGSTDDTVQQIRALAHPRVQVLEEAQRRGKAHALNLAVAATTGDIIVFADVRQQFAPDAISRLVRHFARFDVGAVSGELFIESAASAAGTGVDTYWKLEKSLRRAEARWDSAIGCTGAIYAIRRELYRPIPPDTILDDVVIPMQIATEGWRVGFDPSAQAFDPQTLEPEREEIRKRRTLAGNYQMMARHPAWLLPWKNRLWWQLLAHKYFRLAAPFLLLFLFLANLALVGRTFYTVMFLGQCAFYGLAIAGLKFPGWKAKYLALPAGFVFLNWQAAVALWHYLRGSDQSGWKKN